MDSTTELCSLESFFSTSFPSFYPLIQPFSVAQKSLLPTESPKALCPSCQSLNLCGQTAAQTAETSFYVDISAHSGLRSVAALQASAQRCSLCEFLWIRAERNIRNELNIFNHNERLDLERWESQSEFETLCRVDRDPYDASSVAVSLLVVERQENYGLFPRGIQVRLGEYELRPFEANGSGGDKSGTPRLVWLTEPDPLSSDRLWEKVRGWLEDCRWHEWCTNESNILPDRFIELDLGKDGHSRLCEGSRKQTGRYVALSYCWGEDNVYTLTTNSLGSMQERIDEAALPKTLRDTFTLCRRLQIQYLWVDALCILQDDSRDWAEQSAKMDQVYGNAYLTVCATNASSAAAGFLGRRTPSHHLIGASEHNGQRYPIYITDHIHRRSLRGLFSPGVGGGGHLQQEPLVHRAWTIQERMLSPRTLHFGSFRAIWACRAWTRTEDGIEGEPQVDGVVGMIGMTSSNAFYKWWILINHYTSCKLTRESDRLPALSGMARQAAKIIRDEYIAGNWKGDLFDCMHWSIRHDKSARQSVYVAPSWSWASIKGSISAGRVTEPSSLYIAKVLSTNTVLVGPDRFGAVADCEVVLRAPYITGVLIFEEEALWHWSWPGRKSKIDTDSCRFDVGVWIDEPQKMIDQAKSCRGRKAVAVELIVTMRRPNGYSDDKRPNHIMLEEHPQYWPYCGLIVAPVAKMTQNRYRRLGIFECHQAMHLPSSSFREVILI